MIAEDSSEPITVHGYGRLIREWRCPFCHKPVTIVDWLFYIWFCEACGALYMGGLEFRYYDSETEKEIEELREEYEYICEADA